MLLGPLKKCPCSQNISIPVSIVSKYFNIIFIKVSGIYLVNCPLSPYVKQQQKLPLAWSIRCSLRDIIKYVYTRDDA